MINLKKAVAKFIREEEGLTVVEYAIAGGLIGLAVATSFTNLGAEVQEAIERLVAVLTAANDNAP